ncbi:Asd/ArgC dimerization domain-containing protein, partial [Bacteroidota bacterium]
QSVSGSGYKAVAQMDSERKGEEADMVYPHPIDLNVLPHGGNFEDNGYTTEEVKLVNETRKILGDDDIQLTATVVRVPVKAGHSEAVNVEFENDFDLEEVKNILENTEGIIVEDDPMNYKYPMPVYCEGKDEVFVGRLRRDFSNPNTLNMWVVADNLRKGAATNAVQIAEYLVRNRLV